MKSFGFIITRCVKTFAHGMLWIECYKCIRNIYRDTKIIIIDDNSNYQFIDDTILTNDKNLTIINSTFLGVGEILSYYYFYKIKPFDVAIVIHDSMFIQKKLDIEDINIKTVKFLWYFDKSLDPDHREIEFIKKLKQTTVNRILKLRTTDDWYGCFGVSSIINYQFLKELQNTYDIFNLVQYIKCRKDRMIIERVFPLVCIDKINSVSSINGDIIEHKNKFFYTFLNYKSDEINNTIPSYKFIKIWSGR